MAPDEAAHIGDGGSNELAGAKAAGFGVGVVGRASFAATDIVPRANVNAYAPRLTSAWIPSPG